MSISESLSFQYFRNDRDSSVRHVDVCAIDGTVVIVPHQFEPMALVGDEKAIDPLHGH